MDHQEIYRSRLVSLEEAMSKVQSGDHIVPHHSGAEPYALFRELFKRTDLKGLRVTSGGSVYGEYSKPEYRGSFQANSLFANPSPFVNRAVADGHADFVPIFLKDTYDYLTNYYPPDVTLLQVTPPNEDGYVSLGISVDYSLSLIDSTKRVIIAQVNSKMPFTTGDALVHVSKIDYFVELDQDILVYPPYTNPTEMEVQLCKNVAALIDDGACLQLGLGNLPDTVLSFLGEKNDLGVHTECFTDGMVDLVNKGVITGKRKNIDVGKIVSTFLVGTSKLYNFVNRNDMLRMKPVNYVNDPFVISQNDNVISVNGCLQVDILGQVASDCIGSRQIAGVGGQVDFVRGAARSKGGKSILVAPSLALGGKASAIVPVLSEGTVVTTTRYDVQYIVTEYGVADLKFHTRRERAEQLIAIAHPDYRDALRDSARERKII